MDNTLVLILKKKWYDMITSSVKREEYREITPYWAARLLGEVEYSEDESVNEIHALRETYFRGMAPEEIQRLMHDGVLAPRHTYVTFYHGYAKNRPAATYEVTDIAIGPGRLALGAERGRIYFVIKIKDL